MIGGGVKIQKLFSSNSSVQNMITVFMLSIFLLFVRAYIVQISYNIIWPKFMYNLGGDRRNFEPISFYDSLLLVILFSFLFRF